MNSWILRSRQKTISLILLSALSAFSTSSSAADEAPGRIAFLNGSITGPAPEIAPQLKPFAVSVDQAENALDVSGRMDYSSAETYLNITLKAQSTLTGNVVYEENLAYGKIGSDPATFVFEAAGTVNGDFISRTHLRNELIVAQGGVFNGNVEFENSTWSDDPLHDGNYWERAGHDVRNEGTITGSISNLSSTVVGIFGSSLYEGKDLPVFEQPVYNKGAGGIYLHPFEYLKIPAIHNKSTGIVRMAAQDFDGTFDAPIYNEGGGTIEANMPEAAPYHPMYAPIHPQWDGSIYNNVGDSGGRVVVNFGNPYFNGVLDNGAFTQADHGTIDVQKFVVDNRHALVVAGTNTWNILVEKIQVKLANYGEKVHVRQILHGDNDNWKIALEDENEDFTAKENGSVNNGRGIFDGTDLKGPITGDYDFINWSQITEDRIDSEGYIHLNEFVIPEKTPATHVAETVLRLGTRKAMMIDSILASSERDHLEGRFSSESVPGVTILPYGSFSTVSLSSMTSDVKAHTKGIIGMVHVPVRESRDLLTGYLGYETTDMEDAAASNGGSSTAKDKTVLGGIKYLHTLTENEAYRWFLSAHVKASFTDSDLTYTGADGSLEVGTNMTGFAATLLCGVAVRLGDKDAFTPRLGFGYEHLKTGGFFLFVDNPAQNVNLALAEGSLSWTRTWTEGISSIATLGAKSHLNRSIGIDTVNGEARIRMAPVYGYSRLGLVIEPNSRMNYSVNYAGTFSNDGRSHALFAKVNFLF